jgi:hypothetical protein
MPLATMVSESGLGGSDMRAVSESIKVQDYARRFFIAMAVAVVHQMLAHIDAIMVAASSNCCAASRSQWRRSAPL